MNFGKKLKKALSQHIGLLSTDTCYDVLGRNAVAVLIMLAVYELTGERIYLI